MIGSLTELCGHAYFFIMAARTRRESGFYASLNSISTVDMLSVVRRRKTKGQGWLWEVERLIAKRESATVSLMLCVFKLSWEFDMCSILKTTAIVHLNLKRGIPNVYEQRRERCNGSLMIKNFMVVRTFQNSLNLNSLSLS